jgi:hypothetical protein
MTVATGTLEPVAMPAGTLFVNWSDRGLQAVVLIGSGELAIADVIAGSVRPLVRKSDLRPLETLGISQIAWSRDGRRIAFSTSRFNGFDLALECVIRIVDIQAGSIQRVAVTKRAAIGGLDPLIAAMDFSPDGRGLAYVTGTPTSAEVYIATAQ